MPTQKKKWSAFNFCESVSTCKKSVYFTVHSSDTINFRVPSTYWLHHFWPCPSPKFTITFQFASVCTSIQKIILFHQFILEIQSILESRDQIGQIHFRPCTTKKCSINFHFFLNLYQHAKNVAVLSICSDEKLDSKILQSDWLRVFLPISQKQDFSLI